MLYSYAVYVFLLNPYMFARDCIQESLMIDPYRELFFVAGTQGFALAGRAYFGKRHRQRHFPHNFRGHCGGFDFNNTKDSFYF